MPQLNSSQIKSYLDKIGFVGKPAVNLPTLTQLVEKHIFTFPFETISLHDSTLDEDPSRYSGIAIEDIFKRSINENRGGNCVSLNILLQEVLTRIGFDVTPILADTMWNSPEPKGERSKHCAGIVSLGEKKYLIDAGFGSVGLLSPILLTAGEHKQFSERFNIAISTDYEFECQVWNQEKWESLYGFNIQKARAEDYVRVNKIQTNPLDKGCSFSELMLCTMPFKTEKGNGRVRICNNKVTIYKDDEIVQHQRITSQKKLSALLLKHFKINLKGHKIRFSKKDLSDFQAKPPQPILHAYTRRTKQTAIKVPPKEKNSLSGLTSKMRF